MGEGKGGVCGVEGRGKWRNVIKKEGTDKGEGMQGLTTLE